MNFNEKLQELRKQKNITQEELAEVLFVSRTAISKWESGRGYPNIESLKAISKYFSVTIDELLSGEEVLSIAEEDNKQKESHFRDLVFGLLDLCPVTLLFLPFFGQRLEGKIYEVSLLTLTEVAPWLRVLYFTVVIAILVYGVVTLAFQNCQKNFWIKNKGKISIILNTLAVLLFIVSLQPYVAVFLFIFLIIKVFIVIKSR